ncbi:SAF domain-containing protein, partial [Campylobacter lanienae]|uniref:SAF domain-containing protein n=1 Tax=Campylobacter lanienae TaxID=75658 RepID=UPI00242B255F
HKIAIAEEQVTIDFAFASVCAIKDIREGEMLTKDNIWVKRPGTGEILAESYNEILGKKATNDIPLDTHLSWKDII